jgi:hypothetical protein
MLEVGKTYRVYPDTWDEPYLFEIIKYVPQTHQFDSGHFTVKCTSIIGDFDSVELDYAETVMLAWQEEGFIQEIPPVGKVFDEDLFEL